jgi:hypothetical protein
MELSTKQEMTTCLAKYDFRTTMLCKPELENMYSSAWKNSIPDFHQIYISNAQFPKHDVLRIATND